MMIVDSVLNFYDIDVFNIDILSKGYASKKWIINNGDEKKYILKEIVKQSFDRLSFILLIQNQLDNLSAKIIKTKYNDLFVEFDNKFYYLCEYLDNEEIIIDKDIYNIGCFLAKLHQKMLLINNIHSDFLKIEDNISILEEYLEYHQQHNNLEYVKYIEYKLLILKKLKLININFNHLTKQIIHGDFYIDNIIKTNNLYKIVDFDQCCDFYKEYEILRGMFMICNGDGQITDYKKNLMIQFINGYCTIGKIEYPEDAYNFYLYIQANSLSSIKPEDFNIKEKRKFAKKRFNILNSLVENKKEILEILKGEKI